ncbi:hypothetical protein F2Q68_00011741 [Brassica cretica]|uniref:Uncharacterized protein n=1 Tax=Brassica cretica TaxID=69181 RepID=A0A8S9L260_BRACR|nr:hypothetical protein F2Q68_00011741 [Brassica cretica]
MGSRSESKDQSTFDPHYSPPNTVDFATQEVLATLAAADEVADQIASQEAGVTRADGKQQGSKKRLISLVDDTDDSDVEISQPTQKTKPRRQTSFRTATGKPMLQSTIDGGVGSSAQACSKGKSVPMKSVIRGGRRKSPTKSKKKKGSILQHHEVFWSVRKCSGAACSVKHDQIHNIDVCPAGQPAKKCAFGGTGLGRPFGDRSPRGPDPP